MTDRYAHLVTDRTKWPQDAFELEKIVHTLHPTTDLCIYQIDMACDDDDDAEVFFVDAPTIALARYGEATNEEVNKLGMTINQYWNTCNSMEDPKKKRNKKHESVLDRGICLNKGTITNRKTGKKMPRLLSISLARLILHRSHKYNQSKKTEDNEVEPTPDELVVRRAVATLTIV